MIRVGLNAYGTIGRRVADAIRLQPDMELVGVVKRTPDYLAFLAAQKGIKLYTPDQQTKSRFEQSGLKVEGTMEEMFSASDIIVDASPEKGEENKQIYERLGKRVVFQGGEEHSIAGTSFVAQCNYDEAVNKQYVRVVSCNTTALCRVLKAVDDVAGIEKAIATLVRRATDPNDPKKGPIDSVVPDPVQLPSHHAEDVKTVLHGINLTTMAVKVPTTHMHLHALAIKLKDPSIDRVLEGLEKAPRIVFFESKQGYSSTSGIMDFARELRPRGDLHEVAVWRDSVKVSDGWLYLFMAIHQEAIVIPENIDCIRAMLGKADAKTSIETTNKSLGLIK
ncbi:MAG: type II glyceraldehyde-3-phosphate dehydrogenase [Conexivisphaerales archaeon]